MSTEFNRLGVVVENPLERKSGSSKDLCASALYPVDEQSDNGGHEQWRQSLRSVLSRAAPLHEAVLYDGVEIPQSRRAGSVHGHAPGDKLKSFAYLPEMIVSLRGYVQDFLRCKSPTSTASASYMLYMYIQIIVRELQVILDVTVMDPSFAVHLDTQLVGDFNKLWTEMVYVISELGDNAEEDFDSVITPLIEVSQDLIAHWGSLEQHTSCLQYLEALFARASGTDPNFSTADDRDRALVFTGLCLFHLSTVSMLPCSGGSLHPLVNAVVGVIVSAILLSYYLVRKYSAICYAVLLLSSLSPLLYHMSFEDRVPWGILFIPAWVVTVLGTPSRQAVFISSFLYTLSFLGRAALVYVVEGSEYWLSDVCAAGAVFMLAVGLLINNVVTDTLSTACMNSTDAALYRHIAILTLRSWKSNRPFRDTIPGLLAQLNDNDTSLTDEEVTQLGSLATVIKQATRARAKATGREPKKRSQSVASECSAVRMSKMTSSVNIKERTTRRTSNNTTARFPFGELTFPDPFDPEGENMLHIDNRAVHPYLGIVVVNGDGEILLWNHKMSELTGIAPERALSNEIISFVIDAEQVTLLQIMEDALLNQVLLSDPVLIPFIRSDNVNRMYLEVSVASVVAEGEYLILLAIPPVGEAMQHMELAKWLFEQFMPSTNMVFNKILQLSNANLKGLKQQATDCMKRIQNVHNLVLRIDNEEACLCYLHIKTMLNKMLADFQKIAASRDIRVTLLPILSEVPSVVYTQPEKLACAVGYLMSNAMKFSNNSSEITMSLALTRDNPTDVGTINLCIADTGAGISPDKLKTIFDAAARDEHSKLGLPTAAAQINELGGYIDATSTLGQGSTFSIKLPYLYRDEPATSPKHGEHVPDDSGGGSGRTDISNPNIKVRCLLLEANRIYRTAFCHQFWERGYSLVTSPSLQSHLDPQEFDLIVVGISSIDSAADFLEQLKNCPAEVIIASKLFTDYHRNMIEEAGWFGLKLPPKRIAMHDTLAAVEARIAENQRKAMEIDGIRRAFEGNASCPWERGKQIGHGSFGRVYLATNKLTGGKMACKIIPLPSEQEELMAILREVTVMASLSHRNIIHYFYCERGDDELYIFMELADGCLSEKIPVDGMAAAQASVFMRDILRGLQYLHSKNIVHRDVKVANVLIHGNCCKLTDFGTAVHMNTTRRASLEDQKLNTIAGTPHYMAPEIINDHGHDWKADIWSIGCLLMEMVTNKPPWSHTGEGSWAAVKYVCDLTSDSMINFGSYGYHDYVLGFLKACLHLDPHHRPDTTHLLETPFLTEMNDELARKSSVCELAGEVGATIVRTATPGKCIQYEEDEDAGALLNLGDLTKPAASRSRKKTRKPTKIVKASDPIPEDDEEDDFEDEYVRRGTNFSGWGGGSL